MDLEDHPSIGWAENPEPQPDPELCRYCGEPIVIMARKNTGFCTERHEDAHSRLTIATEEAANGGLE